MDRINNFLSKRPVKHKKTIKYKNESYEITKNDLKLVRNYRARKCLDKTVKLSRVPDLRLSERGHEGIPMKNKPDNSQILLEKTKKYYALHPLREKASIDKNIIKDIWADDTIETIQEYKQEWVYSIKDQYNEAIEKCVFTKEDLKSELRRIYLNQFRPREVKNKLISELLPKLPDSKELKPYPEDIAMAWKIEGKKYIYTSFVCSISNSNILQIIDLKYDSKVVNIKMKEEVRHLCGDGMYLYVSTDCEIYRIDIKYAIMNEMIDNDPEERCCDSDCSKYIQNIHRSKSIIKDFYVSESKLAVLTCKTVNLYEIEDRNDCSVDILCEKPTKTFIAKYENPHNVKIFNNSVYVSTANGLLIESLVQSDIKTLNYVIDFTYKAGNVYVINNLSRLVVIGSDYGIKKNIVQHQIGKVIKVHSTLNLLAILFSDEIGIYKYFNGEYIPVNTLHGRYKRIEWDGKMPWLYAGDGSRIVMYT